LGRAFKYKDGDYIGPVPIQMIHRLYKEGRRWFAEQTLKHIQYLDSIKDSWCKSNGITIYRIVYKNKNSLKSVKEQLDAYFNTL